MYMITKDYFKAGTRYESPVSEVFTVHTEGVLCASTQMFEVFKYNDTDGLSGNDTMFNW